MGCFTSSTPPEVTQEEPAKKQTEHEHTNHKQDQGIHQIQDGPFQNTQNAVRDPQITSTIINSNETHTKDEVVTSQVKRLQTSKYEPRDKDTFLIVTAQEHNQEVSKQQEQADSEEKIEELSEFIKKKRAERQRQRQNEQSRAHVAKIQPNENESLDNYLKRRKNSLSSNKSFGYQPSRNQLANF